MSTTSAHGHALTSSVRAVFSLARRLSPCVVFIDEVDSLFGARSAKDSSGSGRSHNQLLTEFMQEMDGLNSAITNREQRVVVVGATNRPFDLDEAVLRRLPRRLLIDLPRQEDRKGESAVGGAFVLVRRGRSAPPC
jgi:SpoVK/Ycf46/Vps4 family AAA+-type ATPase